MYVTVLPVASKTYFCSPKANNTSPLLVTKRVLQLISGFGLSINGKHTYCGDYIYSGHTVVLVLSYLIIKECKYFFHDDMYVSLKCAQHLSGQCQCMVKYQIFNKKEYFRFSKKISTYSLACGNCCSYWSNYGLGSSRTLYRGCSHSILRNYTLMVHLSYAS